jgi:hypothetical protein
MVPEFKLQFFQLTKTCMLIRHYGGISGAELPSKLVPIAPHNQILLQTLEAAARGHGDPC